MNHKFEKGDYIVLLDSQCDEAYLILENRNNVYITIKRGNSEPVSYHYVTEIRQATEDEIKVSKLKNMFKKS